MDLAAHQFAARAVEFGQAFHVRPNLVYAASEAARIGTQLSCPRATEAEAVAVARSALRSSGLDPASARILLGNTGGTAGTDMVVDIAYDAHVPMLTKILCLPALSAGTLEVAVHIEAENE